jgi:hypothetical protein
MTVLRLIGMLFVIAAIIALTSDLSRGPSTDTAAGTFASLYRHWSDFAPQTLAATQKFVANRLHPLVWDGIIRPFLILPAWMSLGSIGLVLAYLGRRRRRVEIFTN